MRYELTNHEWAAIKPFLPNKPRGVPRVNDRRVLNGIFWVLRSGAPWRDLRTTLARTPPAPIGLCAGDSGRLGRDYERVGRHAWCNGANDQYVDYPRASARRLHRAEQETIQGPVPKWLQSRTPNNGTHHFYCDDIGLKSTKGVFGVGLDTRARGGMAGTVVTPSDRLLSVDCWGRAMSVVKMPTHAADGDQHAASRAHEAAGVRPRKRAYVRFAFHAGAKGGRVVAINRRRGCATRQKRGNHRLSARQRTLTATALGRIVVRTWTRRLLPSSAGTREAAMIVMNILLGKRGHVVTIEPPILPRR
jgi:hypothetical protein